MLFQGIMTEMKRSMMIVLKLNKKIINIKLSISKDFLIQVSNQDLCYGDIILLL